MDQLLILNTLHRLVTVAVYSGVARICPWEGFMENFFGKIQLKRCIFKIGRKICMQFVDDTGIYKAKNLTK